jgi:hypothetical protein
MSVDCIYDNPLTYRREHWRDGFCIRWVDMDVLERCTTEDRCRALHAIGAFYHGPWAKPLVLGQVHGNAWALVDRLGQAWM